MIDDWIPVKNDNLIFSRANGPELWVILLEKAFSKLHGSYARMTGGLPMQALKDLTGAPYFEKQFQKHSAEDIWATMELSDQHDWCMAGFSYNNDDSSK